MANAIRYSFVATGADQVRDAFKSIAQEAQRSAKVTERSHTGSARAASSSARAMVAAEDRASSQAIRIAHRESKEKERALKHVSRIRDRYYTELQRGEEKSARAVEQSARRRAASEEKANAKIRSARAAAFGKVGNFASGVGRGLASAAAILGVAPTAALAAAARQNITLGESANRAAINARLAGQKADPAAIKKSWEAAALANPGVSSSDVGSAALAFQSKTGNLPSAGMLGVFATTAQGSDANLQDVSSAAAALKTQFAIDSVDDMADALSALVVQGAKGSFELKDAASQFEKLGGAARRFGLDRGVKGVATLGGLTQIAKSVKGSPEEAATAVDAMMRQLIAKSDVIEKEYGVKVFRDKGKTQTRNILDVMTETIAGAKGNLPSLQKTFDVQGMAGVSPLVSAFNEAGGGTSGMKAMRAALDAAIDTTNARTQVEQAAASAQGDASSKLSAAWEKMVAAVAPAVDTALPQLVAAIPAVVEAFGALANVINKIVGALAPDKTPRHIDESNRFKTQSAGIQAQIDAARKGGAPASVIAQLEAQKKSADASGALAESKAWGSSAKVFGKDMTEEAFTQEFIRRGGGDMTSKILAGDAFQYAEGLQGGHGETATDFRGALVNSMANKSQKDLVEQYQIQRAAERTSTDPNGPAAVKGADQAQKFGAMLMLATEAAKAQAEAAKQAAVELSKISSTGQASTDVGG